MNYNYKVYDKRFHTLSDAQAYCNDNNFTFKVITKEKVKRGHYNFDVETYKPIKKHNNSKIKK